MTTLKNFKVFNDDSQLNVKITRHSGWSSKDGLNKNIRVSVRTHDLAEHDNICLEALETIVHEMQKYDSKPEKESQDSVSTAEEDEEFQRIERKQQETVDCPVVVAHHIHELQKWLKHIGCDDEMELKITSDGLWVSPCAEELYGVKEGGVGTLIEYMRYIGGANKCLEKMEEL